MKRDSLLSVIAGTVLLAAYAPGLSAASLRFNVNTSSIGATPGYIELQFDQANGNTSLAALATVTNFASTGFTFDNSTNAATPGVTGTLRGAQLVIPNDAAGSNYFDQGVTAFGSSFSFLVNFSGPALLGGPSADPSEFLVFLFDSSFNPIVGPLPSGDVADVVITKNGTLSTTGSAFATVVATPEPGTFVLVGMAGLLAAVRRFRR